MATDERISKQHDGGWRRRGTRVLFRNDWFALRQDDLILPDDSDVTYTYLDHGGYVVVVPRLTDGRLVMERVFRHTVQRTLLECPMGGLDGESPEDAARRELEEETGYRAGGLTMLGTFFGSTGISNEKFHVFLAMDLVSGGVLRREPTEQMVVELMSAEEVFASVYRGEISNGPTALALLLAEHALRR